MCNPFSISGGLTAYSHQYYLNVLRAIAYINAQTPLPALI